MTDNDVIKALECCSNDNIDCEECPANGLCDNDDYCFTGAILDLINRQQAEIEQWKTLAHEGKEKVELQEIEKSAMQHRIDKQQAEIERLKDIAKSALNESIKVCDSILNAKSEAYKEFAEQFQAMLGDPFLREHNDVCVVIDKILAEVTPSNFTKVDHNSLCETETYKGDADNG